MFSQNICQLLLLTFLVTVPFASAQNERAHHDDHHEMCREDKDCGAGATCEPSTHECRCPGTQGKNYIVIPDAKPICQEPADIGEPCKYSEQCTHTAGDLAHCNKDTKKCECYDTKNDGRDVMRSYRKACYHTTTLNYTCTDSNQCKASIEPEEHVSCVQDPSSNSRKGLCKCDVGEKCEDKKSDHNGAGVIEVASILRFTLVGIMATKVFL